VLNISELLLISGFEVYSTRLWRGAFSGGNALFLFGFLTIDKPNAAAERATRNVHEDVGVTPDTTRSSFKRGSEQPVGGDQVEIGHATPEQRVPGRTPGMLGETSLLAPRGLAERSPCAPESSSNGRDNSEKSRRDSKKAGGSRTSRERRRQLRRRSLSTRDAARNCAS
jgi:hypothetical protein